MRHHGCAGEPLDSVETLHRNSLLLQEETVADEEPRFRMLETIREYGLELLAASGAEDELRQRHVDYFLSFAEEAARGFFSPATASWLDRVESDHANLRTAVRWCIEHKDAEQGSAPGGRALVVLVRPRVRDRGPRSCWRRCWPCPRLPPRRSPERKRCWAQASWR